MSRYTIANRSRRICWPKGKGFVAKKTQGLCVCESEEHEDGVGAGAKNLMQQGISHSETNGYVSGSTSTEVHQRQRK
jgi:hypothetical protein